NAWAAADSAEKAARLAKAAGAGSNRAQSAAEQARRHASEADRAANASAALARQSAQAAYQARDAARSAATHAENAATAADNAAQHAGQSAEAAAEATRQAEEARKAANTASEAVKTAGGVYELARKTEAEDLAARTAASVEAARDLKTADDEDTAGIGAILAEWQAQDQEAATLTAEATRPDADSKALAARGRKAALTAMKTGGPWSQEAAADALSGTDDTVLDWVRTGRDKAERDDMRQSVWEVAQDSSDEVVRTAAAQALKGDADQVKAFYTVGQYEAAVTDNRVRAYQLIATGGTSVKEAAEKALRDGSPKAVAAFLRTGQRMARQTDERVSAYQLLASGGPEVQAAAKIALAGTPELVHDFLTAGQYMADRKDQLATTHAAQMSRLVAEASQTAAKAQQDAWEATEAAAVASNASAEADNAHNQARASAAQADQYAANAKTSAQDAEGSAARASKSATTARNAAQMAARDASKATASAARARASANQARGSADSAREASFEAHVSAVAAGKDATQAKQAEGEAWDIVAEKRSQERTAALKAEDERIQAEAKQVEEEFTKELEKEIRAGIEKDKKTQEESRKNTCYVGLYVSPIYLAECSIRKGDKAEFHDSTQEEMQAMKQLFKTALGVDTFQECVAQKSVASCAQLAVELIPAGKTVKLLTLAKKVKTAEEAAKASRINRLEQSVETCVGKNSFPAGTLVLMADGSSRQIEQIRVGDHVRATDPESGETSSRRVDATIYTPDDRDFTDLMIISPDRATGMITSTGNHPFWVESQRTWRNAADLKAGDTLRTATGQTAQITSTRHWKTLQPAYNLTVNTVHTYHVLAGATPVLVHNSGGCLIVLRNWSSQQFKVGNEAFLLDRKGMDHILTRHHPKYWDGSVKVQQSFFDAKMSVEDVQSAIEQVMKMNRDDLLKKGSRGMYQIKGKVNGVDYVLGMNRGRVGQFYPVNS
ncbi:polymorphic toxin-type HINT domain-containing protein, partial [Kitasatospora sp. NPDC059803]|uniref:polymorphic toxin-type HINT domain-containing protein n=1 Tax=Kitasatospora sp. NPDC059803 TaxID=3346953 RepID=UPI0036606807